MRQCPIPIAFLRRRQKFLILLLIAAAVAVYGLIKTDHLPDRIVAVGEVGGRLKKYVLKEEEQVTSAKDEMNAKDQVSIQERESQRYNPKQEALPSCRQNYPPEANTDYNTFELYKQIARPRENIDRTTSIPKASREKLKVFVVPMTHVDPGWLRTFASYSEDTNSILNNMLTFLKSHPKMRFIWCEIVFLERWWGTLNETQKADVKKLVESGQLEMASGSWVMTDEANPYFAVSVDNIIEGQQFIFNELNAKPRVIWSNDPFGYGPTVPYLFTKTGINKAVINRIHHGMKNHLQSKRAIPFRWRQHFDPLGKNDVLTQVLPYAHYDILNSCGPSPVVCCEFDFKRITHFSCLGPKPVPITKDNVKQKARQLEDQLNQMSNLYESNVLLVMWGDDFRYDMIEEWYQHYDNLMPLFDQINAGASTEIRFGTFKDYFSALEEFYGAKKSKPVTLSGDFFPYRCAMGDLWTGYFTTRPFFKKLGRKLHSFIRAADIATTSAMQLMSASEREMIKSDLINARRNLSLFQHHDAITGTSKKHVMADYAQLLFGSLQMASDALTKAVNLITKNKFKIDNVPLQYDQISSRKLIQISENKEVYIAVYNSRWQTTTEIIRLRVSSTNIKVMEGADPVTAQIEPYYDFVTGSLSDDFQLVFAATLQPLTTSIFKLKYEDAPKTTTVAEVFVVNTVERPANRIAFRKAFNVVSIDGESFGIRTSRVTTTHNSSSGLIEEIVTESAGKLELQQYIEHYARSAGGAYIMRHSEPFKSFELKNLSRFVVKGPLQQTAYISADHFHQQLSVQEIPGYRGELLHFEMRVDIRELKNVELITAFSTDLSYNSTDFFTDSNGLQLIRREFHTAYDTSGNYYPMPTAAVLQDGTRRVSILSDLEHGAVSRWNTGVEIMLDRIHLRDDGKGLGGQEDGIPSDMLPVDIRFTIVVERLADSAELPVHFAYNTLAAHYELQSLLYKPFVFVSEEKSSYVPPVSLSSLPCDYQLISSRPIGDDANQRLVILYRVGMDCSSRLAATCSVADLNKTLSSYLKSVGVSKVQITSLNGIEKIGNEVNVDELQISLEPLDFASFIIRI